MNAIRSASLDPHALLARPFAPIVQDYSIRDTLLYALAIGMGAEPADTGALSYVYEGAPGGLLAVPTMVNVLGYTGFWADQPGTGITWRQLVHVEQAITLHRELPAAGRVVGHNRVVGLHDRGNGKGALMLQERRVCDAESGTLWATVMQTTLLRADGGFGIEHGASHGVMPAARHAVPTRPGDACCDLPTLPQAALLYRLNGDFNPLHADPDVARSAGFARPILHGLATMGGAMHAALKTLLAYDVSAVRGMRVRFTAPVWPGDTLRTELWRDGDALSFRTTAVERGMVVLDAGRIDLA